MAALRRLSSLNVRQFEVVPVARFGLGHFMRTLNKSPPKHARLLSIATENREENANGKKRLTISDNCIKRLQTIAKEGEVLRVTVEGGGCSGFIYKFALDTLCNSDDVVFSEDGVEVVIDSLSLSLVEGAVVDYHEELVRSSFRLTDMPLAEKGCSCGASFSLK